MSGLWITATGGMCCASRRMSRQSFCVKVGRKKLGRMENVRGCFIGFSPEPKTGLGIRDSGIDSGIRTKVEGECRYIYSI